MKFNFEKHEAEKIPKQPETELTQEEFDEQILVEAQKLKVSIDSLMEEINAHGGAEKFKEIFERPVILDNPGNVLKNKAGFTLQMFNNRRKENKQKGRGAILFTSVMAGFTAILVSLGIYNPGPGDLLAIYTGGITAFLGLCGSIGVVVEKLEARKEIHRIDREKGKKELEFKMTGTEVK